MTILNWTLPRRARALATMLRPSSAPITPEVFCLRKPGRDIGSAGFGIQKLRGQFLGTGLHTSYATRQPIVSTTTAANSTFQQKIPLYLAVSLPILATTRDSPAECTRRAGNTGEMTIKTGNLIKKGAETTGFRILCSASKSN